MRAIDTLKPHPLQAELIRDMSEAELESLQDSIAQTGQQQPIEITTDNVILDGHQRVAALRKLGRAEAWVRVRKDLDTPDKVAAYFVDQNLNRRQLDPLDKVRLATKLFELERTKESSRLSVKEYIAQRLGMTRRNLDRYLSVAETPMPVQNAYSQRRLSLVSAARVARLSTDVQSMIAAQIAGGEDAEKVVHAYVNTASQSTSDEKALQALLKAVTTTRKCLRALPRTFTIPKGTRQALARMHEDVATLLERCGS